MKIKSVAIVLILCMLLSTIPTLAATVSVNSASNQYISVEGVTPGSVNLVDNWCTVDGDGAVRFRFDDRSWFLNAFGITSLDKVLGTDTAGSSANNVLAGVYAKGTLSTKSGDVLYFKDVPVSFVSRGSNNVNALIFLKRTDINANVYDQAYTNKLSDGPSVNSNTTVTAGTISTLYSKTITTSFDTKAFPEGTIFVTATDLTILPDGVTGWNLNNEDGYSIYRPSSPTGDGYMGVFEVTETGSYSIYGFRKEKSDGGRNASVKINGVVSKFNSANYSGAAWDSTTWFWDKPGEGGMTIDLIKGQNLIVQLAKDGYANTGRLAAIALVPSNSDFVKEYSATAAQNSELKFSSENLSFLSSMNTGADVELGDAVAVTVNGVSVDVQPQAAVKSGLTVANCDFYGDYIKLPTVLDALVAAQSNITMYDVTSFAAGSIGKPVYVNGVQVFDLDKAYIKTGDTVTVLENFDSTNFEPVPIGTLRETEGANNGNLAKLCLNQSRTQKALPFLSNPAAATEASDTNLVNCTLNGYFEVVKDLNVVVNDAETIIPAGEKIYLQNVIVGSLANKTTRYDLNLNGLYAVSDLSKTAFDLDGTGEGTACKNKPFTYQFQNPSNYNFNTGYLTNSSATGEVTVECKEIGSGEYLLKTDGSAFVEIITVTYGADGAIVSIDTEDVYVTVKEPVCVNVSDNQKVFLWDNKPLDGTHDGITSGGTTMRPICQPLEK